jgi:hypothetical protein
MLTSTVDCLKGIVEPGYHFQKKMPMDRPGSDHKMLIIFKFKWLLEVISFDDGVHCASRNFN